MGDCVGEWLRCESLEALYNSYGFIILCGKVYAIPMKTIFLTTVSGSEGVSQKMYKKRPDPPRSKKMSKIHAKTYFSKLVPFSSTFLFFWGTISAAKDLLGQISLTLS